MYTKRNISLGIVIRFAWAHIMFFILYAALITYIHHNLEHIGSTLALPFLPISTIGIAVAFYIGFKNNSSYDRFWEGRKIWGAIVNYSRTWGNQVMSFVSTYRAFNPILSEALYEEQKKLIYRHLAWINALRLNLRQPASHSIKHTKSVKAFGIGSPERKHWDEEVGMFLDDAEYKEVIEYVNTPTQILRKQGEHLRQLMEEKGLVDDFRHMELMRVLEEGYNFQGKCERIKNTPLPRQYAFFSKVFTWIFVLLLPFGLIGEFNAIGHNFIWLTIPFSVLISWIFMTMELVGDTSEDPFEGFINDVPMSALCRTIERDLRQMLAEKEIPESIKANKGILM